MTESCSHIREGKPSEIRGEGEWIFVDLGFAQSTNKSTGYLHIRDEDWAEKKWEEEARNCTFAGACERVIEAAREGQGVLHLVLEAPLSCTFKDGNPIPRELDTWKDGKRPWYIQPAPVVMTAALFLLHRLQESLPVREVAIFEGFVSFGAGGGSDHKKDVCVLAAEVRKSRYKVPQDACPIPFLRGYSLGIPPVILVRKK